MATFTKTYTPAAPVSTDLVSGTDTVIRDFKVGVQERLTLEHYDFVTGNADPTSVGAQGRHKPGGTQAVHVGDTASIAALTGMTKGCLAYDTTLGVLQIYGTTWTSYQVGSNYAFKLIRAAANITFSPGQTMPVTFSSISFGGVAYTDLPNSRFVVPMTGIYSFSFLTAFTGTDNKTSCGLSVGGVGSDLSGMGFSTNSTNVSVATGSGLLSLTTGDFVTMWTRYETASTRSVSAWFSGFKVG